MDESNIAARIENLEQTILDQEEELIAMVGCGGTQFIGIVKESDRLSLSRTGVGVSLDKAGTIVINRGIQEVAPGSLKIIKQAFIASITLGAGPQKITANMVDFYQLPRSDLSKSDYVTVLEEYKRFLNSTDTRTEQIDEPTIFHPNVLHALAEQTRRGGHKR